jgi:hypothetical protein
VLNDTECVYDVDPTQLWVDLGQEVDGFTFPVKDEELAVFVVSPLVFVEGLTVGWSANFVTHDAIIGIKG